VTEREQVVKRSCAFCQTENREELEKALLNGEISCKELDKDMTWRANTADRHFKNHMGEYHMDSNPACVICSNDRRGEFETGYFEGILPSEDIAEVIGCSENSVYHHMKYHFQPLVKKAAAFEVALTLGQETKVLRNNVEKLNEKFNELLDYGSVHEDGFVGDAVKLHKEVRESIKDLVKLDEKWGADTEGTQINQTFNILKVELAKESPDSWKRIKEQLIEQQGE
jgi:hypothetical protein